MCHHREVDEDPAETEPAESHGWWRSQFARQVEEPTHVLAPVLLFVTLWALAVPGWHLLASRLCLVGWMVLGVLGSIAIVRRARGRLDVPLWMLMVLPVLAVMVTAAAMTEAPVRVRFQLANETMTRSADQYLRDPGSDLGDSIGPFGIEWVTRRGDAVYYVVGGGGSDDQYGFVYRPAGPPGETGRDRFTHPDGDWYLWYSNSPRLLFR